MAASVTPFSVLYHERLSVYFADALCYHKRGMAELASGERFADHVILDVAGRGGMGIVYRALHEPLQRHVALKLITPALSADETFRSRFRRECQAAVAIRHPHVLPIYHAGEEQGALYGRAVRLRGRLKVLRSDGQPETSAGLLSAVQPLGKSEHLLVRWVLQPDRPQRVPQPQDPNGRMLPSEHRRLLKLKNGDQVGHPSGWGTTRRRGHGRRAHHGADAGQRPVRDRARPYITHAP